MDNPAVEIWACLAMFKLKSRTLYFWPLYIAWVKIVLVKTLETLVRDRVVPEIDFWVISRNQLKELNWQKLKKRSVQLGRIQLYIPDQLNTEGFNLGGAWLVAS